MSNRTPTRSGGLLMVLLGLAIIVAVVLLIVGSAIWAAIALLLVIVLGIGGVLDATASSGDDGEPLGATLDAPSDVIPQDLPPGSAGRAEVEARSGGRVE